MPKIATRHPEVEHRRVALTDEQRELQFQRGHYTVERGERIALPFDHHKTPEVFLGRKLWVPDTGRGVHRPGVKFDPPRSTVQTKALTWLRDNVNENIPYWYYMATLGHDLHVSTWGDLRASHWHVGWADPFTGEQTAPLDPTFETLRTTHFVDHVCDLVACPKDIWGTWDKALVALQGQGGFVENLGWLSGGKVTTAFVSEEISELFVTTGTEYADFDFHEVGTSATAELNTQVALTTTSGIARATGTPTDSDPVYDNAGTVTADATESWEEHGLFNNATSVSMMDRSVTGGQAVNSSDQVTYTYSLTKNAEA